MLPFHACPFSLPVVQAWLKQVKGRNTGCSAFMLALLLTMSEALNRLHQPITDQLQVGQFLD